LVFICGGGAEGGRRCCTRSGPSLLVEEGGQLWRMRKGRHLWMCCWRRVVAGEGLLLEAGLGTTLMADGMDDTEVEGEREGSLVWENRWVG